VTPVLLILTPLVLLIVWGAIYDVRRRRRGQEGGAHSIEAAARRASGDSDARGGKSISGPGGAI